MFNRKMDEKLLRLRFVGFFRPNDVEHRSLRLAIGREGMLSLYWLVDEADGVIADAKFQAFGPPALVLVGEIASELVLRKNYAQASRLTADLLDRHVREGKEAAAFPKESFLFLNQAISAIDKAAYECIDIPVVEQYETTPIAYDLAAGNIPGGPLGGIPGWEDFSAAKKRQIVEEVIDKEVRPYIELDAGGVTVQELRENGELLIAYSGSCTSCHSSTGSTLSAIQNILQARVHPSLTVIPVL
jgi:NifU-like protein